VKYDGYRGLAAISGGKVAFITRNALDLTQRFPEIASALSRITVGEAVLDGEVVATDAKGISHFQQLMAAGAERHYAAFDLLWLEGEDLRARPLEERRDLLESVLAGTPPPIQLAERLDVSVDEVMALAKRRGLEGVIAKLRGSPYASGRSSDWLKLKVTQSQEVAVIGYTPISNGADAVGALHVAVHNGKQFEYAGKVGTGYTAKMRQRLKTVLDEDRVDQPPAPDAPRARDAIWVKPKYVAQVAFTEWTRDGKLRHPSFQGLREDKKPEETTRETPREVSGRHRAPASVAKRSLAQHSEAAHPRAAVALTHGDRVLFPQSKLTKQDVFRYYQRVAPAMVPALTGRPLTLQQWPKGITGPGFFRQNVQGVPEWATTVDVEHERRKVRHLIVDRPETLEWLANQSALTLHVWSSRVPHLTEPDWVVFDLDPTENGWAELIRVALALRGMLEQLGVLSVPKTSGKRGIHVLVPVGRGQTHADMLEFAVAVAQTLEKGMPEIATTERSLRNRRGRLYVDAFQNGMGKTLVAPYSIRAVEGAPVSAPLGWREVTEKLNPLDFNIKSMPKRLDEVGDLFAPALSGRQRLPRLR
jgi:bifunctional non-homologous end joining protein LigD